MKLKQLREYCGASGCREKVDGEGNEGAKREKARRGETETKDDSVVTPGEREA